LRGRVGVSPWKIFSKNIKGEKCERREQGTNFGLTGGARHLQKL